MWEINILQTIKDTVNGRNPAPPWMKSYNEWDVYHPSAGAGFPSKPLAYLKKHVQAYQPNMILLIHTLW